LEERGNLSSVGRTLGRIGSRKPRGESTLTVPPLYNFKKARPRTNHNRNPNKKRGLSGRNAGGGETTFWKEKGTKEPPCAFWNVCAKKKVNNGGGERGELRARKQREFFFPERTGTGVGGRGS